MGGLRDRVRYAGDEVRCPCCEERFGRFKETSDGLQCPRCGSKPRQRLLWLFLGAERLLATPGLRVLHLAPAACIETRLRKQPNLDYVTVGIQNPRADVRADVTALPFQDAAFDRILSSRVLGQAPDERRALEELRRVLNPEGAAVIQEAGADSLEEHMAQVGFRARLIPYAEEMDEAAARRNGVLPPHSGVRDRLYLCQLSH